MFEQPATISYYLAYVKSSRVNDHERFSFLNVGDLDSLYFFLSKIKMGLNIIEV